MEGVLVSAKKEGSTITITVVTDAQGRFSFPRTKLEPGNYLLRTRAVGYDLNDPGYIEVTAQKPAQVDLKLRKTQDLAAQLTNAEWLMSAPGTWDQKRTLRYCVNCHTLERIFRTDYSTDELDWVIARMNGYTNSTNPLRPTLLARAVMGARSEDRDGPSGFPKGIAEYMSTVNLHTSLTWQFPLKTFARPKGRATCGSSSPSTICRGGISSPTMLSSIRKASSGIPILRDRCLDGWTRKRAKLCSTQFRRSGRAACRLGFAS